MSETFEAYMNISLTCESELFQALGKLSEEIFSDSSSQIQYQVIAFGLF